MHLSCFKMLHIAMYSRSYLKDRARQQQKKRMSETDVYHILWPIIARLEIANTTNHQIPKQYMGNIFLCSRKPLFLRC